jgi:dihydroxyacetone kinase
MEQPVEKVTLELNVNEVNVIMAALGRMPYIEVAAVVAKVTEQAKAQLEAQPE